MFSSKDEMNIVSSFGYSCKLMLTQDQTDDHSERNKKTCVSLLTSHPIYIQHNHLVNIFFLLQRVFFQVRDESILTRMSMWEKTSSQKEKKIPSKEIMLYAYQRAKTNRTELEPPF
jgi:hypothetical protein